MKLDETLIINVAVGVFLAVGAAYAVYGIVFLLVCLVAWTWSHRQ